MEEKHSRNEEHTKSDKNSQSLNISGDVSLLSSTSKTSSTTEEYPEFQIVIQSQKNQKVEPEVDEHKRNVKIEAPVRRKISLDEKCVKNGNHDAKSPSTFKNNLGSSKTVSSTNTGSGDLSLSTPDFLEDAEAIMEDIVDVAVDAGHMIKKEVIEGLEILVTPEDFSSEYSWIDGLFGFISIATFAADFISDVFLSSTMDSDPHAKHWAKATLLIAVIPLIIQNLFSIYWYWFDDGLLKSTKYHGRKRKFRPAKWALIIFFHLILMAPVLRQLDVIYFGLRSKKLLNKANENPKEEKSSDLVFDSPRDKGETELLNVTLSDSTSPSKQEIFRERWLHSEIDSAGLDFIGTVTQDVPQLGLQLYVMTQTLPSLSQHSALNKTLIAQLASISLSLFTTAWTVTGFVRAVRLPESGLRSLSPVEIVLLTLSHFCAIAPQVGCFALFASKHLTVCLIVIAVHWLLATVLTFLQFLWLPTTSVRKAMFAHDKQRGTCPRLDDLAFSSALGVALLVTFVDVDGAAPQLQAIYFGVARLIEELVFITMWYISTTRGSWWHWFPFLLASIFFLLCGLFSVLFYKLINRASKSQWNSFRSLPQTPN